MTDLTVTTAGANLLSIQEAKDFLRLDDDYPELYAMIGSIQEKAEAYCARVFTPRTLQLRLDNLGRSTVVTLPRYPVTSITSVKTLDDADAETVVSSTTYYLADQQRLVFTTAPDIQRDYGGLLITYVAGDSGQVPVSVRTGLLKALSTLFENREDYVVGNIMYTLPDTSKTLFDTWRTLW